MGIGQHLDLDMARLLDELLDEDAIVGKARACLVAGAAEAVARLVVVGRKAHALAAAPGRGLDHHGIADAAGDLHRLLGIFDDAEMAGHRY